MERDPDFHAGSGFEEDSGVIIGNLWLFKAVLRIPHPVERPFFILQ